MPTYVYRCPHCQVELEVFHSMHQSGPSACTACHQEGMKRLLTPGNFVLKGEGWYRDGYGLTASQKQTSGD